MEKRWGKRVCAVILALALAMPMVNMASTSKANTTPSTDYKRLAAAGMVSDLQDVEDGDTKTFTVAMMSGNCHLFAEVLGYNGEDGTQYWMTTEYGEGIRNTWFWPSSYLVPSSQSLSDNCNGVFTQYHLYEISVTRDGTKYTFVYRDFTDNNENLIQYDSTDTTNLIQNVEFQIQCRGGEMLVYTGTAQENGFAQGEDGEEIPVLLSHGKDRTREVKKSELKETLPDPAAYTVADLSTQGKAKDGTYADYFLKDDLQEVRIQMDENNLDYVFQNATEKPTVLADSVSIGGKEVKYAGFKSKGNYTLSHTYSDSLSDRFSFTINFGKYIKKKNGYDDGQNFYGVKKISFNNFFFDKTMMKEYCAFKLWHAMGVPAPEYGLAKVYINDEYYGVYFMVESMDSTIIKRSTGSGKASDYIVKPQNCIVKYSSALDSYKDSESGQFTLDSLQNSNALVQDSNGYWIANSLLAATSQGLWERDDSTLQDVAEMMPTVLNWEEKLTLLSGGKDFSGNSIDVNSKEYLELLESIIDTDEVVRYFATHSFIVQKDYMFTWQQNFGLYVDDNGKAMYIPWDYDIGWGAYGGSANAQSIANLNRDVMYSRGTFTDGYTITNDSTPDSVYRDFPMIYVIWQNDSLREKYYKYMDDCAKITDLGGTTSFGDPYDSATISTAIEEMFPKLKEALKEELASNAYYINHENNMGNIPLVQPDTLNLALPNLKKGIAMRSVGVYLQSKNIDSKVTGYGCDYGTVGNSLTGTPSTSGNLTCVNEDTGIFAVANYSDDTDEGPVLSVEELKTNDSVYRAIQSKIGDTKEDQQLIVYHISNTKQPTGKYQLYIPMSRQFAWDGAQVYTYNNSSDTLKKQSDVAIDDNIYSFETSDLTYVAVLKNSGDGTTNEIGYRATFEKDEGVQSVDVYSTQNYDTATSTDVVSCYAKDSQTGEAKKDGNDQINFKINLKDGYELVSVEVTPKDAYKNIKELGEELENGYRITKVTADLTIAITTKEIKSDEEPEKPEGPEITPSEPQQPDSGVNKEEGQPAQTTTQTTSAPQSKVDSSQSDAKADSKNETDQKDSIARVTLLSAKNSKRKAIVIKWKKQSGVKGYQLQYALNKKFTKSKKSKFTTKTTDTVKKLKKKKTYFVRVRAYRISSGKKQYGTWSKVLKVKVKK